MNEQQRAAVKQALEALETAWTYDENNADGYYFGATEAIKQVIAQDALHKMAEDSRTSGLRLDDWDKIGCVHHDCDQCKAVQEPVAWRVKVETKLRDGSVDVGYQLRNEKLSVYDEPLYTTPPAPQPVLVKTYHDGKPWPVAPKPWVGLTDEEFVDLCDTDLGTASLIRAIEAKLREKNGGAA
jgi:hypothetical protein